MVPRNVAAESAAIDAAVEGKTLIALFDRNADTYGDKAAIHWKEGDLWRHLTWTQYRKAVHEAAAGLISIGVKPQRLRGDHGWQPAPSTWLPTWRPSTPAPPG